MDGVTSDHRGWLERDAHRFGDPGSPVDNVTRKIAYEQEHPDVGFRPPCIHDGFWTAILDNGAIELRAANLAHLLNELERRDELTGP